MAYCPNCGNQVSENANFCNACGEKLEQNNSTSSSETSTSSLNSISQEVYIPDNTFKEMFLKTSGRLNRLRYLKRMLVVGVIQSTIPEIITLIIAALAPSYVLYGAGIVRIIFTLMSMPILYFLVVRRLEDINHNNKVAITYIVLNLGYFSVLIITRELFGILQTVLMIPSLIIALYLLFKDGTHGRNDYGVDPLNR